MNINYLHSFDVTYHEAVAIQESLRTRLVLSDLVNSPIRIVAGADISYAKHSDLFFAAVILFSFPEMEIIEEAYASDRTTFPYIPGLLTFREGPALLIAFAKLSRVPDLVLFDGQGIAHPRGIGLASHMGLFLNIPTIGCAKTRLVGTHAEVGEKEGSNCPLIHDNKTVGAVLRTKRRVKPVFISPGQGISLQKSVDLTMSCCRGYRLPEPTRRAHLAVNCYRQEMLRCHEASPLMEHKTG